MPKSQWSLLSYDEKKRVIGGMYKQEGGVSLNKYFL